MQIGGLFVASGLVVPEPPPIVSHLGNNQHIGRSVDGSPVAHNVVCLERKITLSQVKCHDAGDAARRAVLGNHEVLTVRGVGEAVDRYTFVRHLIDAGH